MMRLTDRGHIVLATAAFVLMLTIAVVFFPHLLSY